VSRCARRGQGASLRSAAAFRRFEPWPRLRATSAGNCVMAEESGLNSSVYRDFLSPRD
jgi:hypothetical protein